MLIGELSRRTGVPTKTLRFYEEGGLLPEPGRSPNGYRNYGDDAPGRLAFIAAAQAAGLTLAEVRDVIAIRERGVAPCSHVRELIAAKTVAVTAQIARLRELRRELIALGERAAMIDPAACDPGSVCAVLVPGTGQPLR